LIKMTVPDFQTMMLPLLKFAVDRRQHTHTEAVDYLANEFQLSDEDRNEQIKSGQPRLYNRVGWTTTHLKKAGLLEAIGPGRFRLTERGKELLANPPATINLAFLESTFPEYAQFRRGRASDDDEPSATFDVTSKSWILRQPVDERIRRVLKAAIPDEVIRREALLLLAFAIEAADEERSDAWYVRETAQGLRLLTGRLLACEIASAKMRVTVIGPVTAEAIPNLS
jgi:restriction system protein